MSSIFVRAHLTAKAGREEEFEALVATFVETVAAGEPGTRGFGWYRDGNGGYLVIEHYESDAAGIAHVHNVGHLFPALGEMVETSAPLEIHGEASDELIAMWAAFNPVFFPTVAAI